MPVPESRRRANDKWDAEHMAILTCKVKKTTADAFRAKAKAEGQTVNAILAAFVRQFVGGTEEK